MIAIEEIVATGRTVTCRATKTTPGSRAEHPVRIDTRDAVTARALARGLRTMAAVIEQLQPRSPAFVVVPAPGDRCGNTGKLPGGGKCPGCRACA